VGRGVRAVEGFEGRCNLFAEVEVLLAAQHEIVLGVLFYPLALVGHE
jgi:hypothetical protein